MNTYTSSLALSSKSVLRDPAYSALPNKRNGRERRVTPAWFTISTNLRSRNWPGWWTVVFITMHLYWNKVLWHIVFMKKKTISNYCSICLFPTLKEWSISNFPCSLASNNTSHSMENSTFHSFTQMQDYYTSNSHYITCILLFKRLWECTFWTWEWKG